MNRDESNAVGPKDYGQKFRPQVPDLEFNLDPIFDGPLQEQDQKAQAFCAGLSRLLREQEEVFADDVVCGNSHVERAVIKMKLYGRVFAQFNADPRAAELVRRVEAASVGKALKTVLEKVFKR